MSSLREDVLMTISHFSDLMRLTPYECSDEIVRLSRLTHKLLSNDKLAGEAFVLEYVQYVTKIAFYVGFKNLILSDGLSKCWNELLEYKQLMQKESLTVGRKSI